MDMLKRCVDWFWRDRRTGKIVIAQWPNLWLWIFVAASCVDWIAPMARPAGTGLRIVAIASLIVWAGDEVLRGVNPWRRCLGAAVLIGSIVRFAA